MSKSDDVLKNQDLAINLHELLQMDKNLHFIFRTGFVKEYNLKGNQYPISETFIERHETALHGIDMIYTEENDDVYAMVRIRYIIHVDRAEYMVKRVLCDLFDYNSWEED